MAYNSRLQSSFIQTYPENTGNTVGTVVSTVRAFRLADCTADRDSHPALKLCGDKGIPFFKKFKIILKVYFKFLYLQSCNTDNCGNSSVGRASASQAEGRGFESRFPLNQGRRCSQNIYGFVVPIKPSISKFHQHHIETLYHYGKIKSIFHRPEDKTRSRPNDQDDTPCQGSRNREH